MSGPDRLFALTQAVTDAAAAPGRPLAVAVSGGVDSVTLAVLLHRAGLSPMAFHAASPAVPQEATARTQRICHAHGLPLTVVDAGELSHQAYRDNPVDRCFHCKDRLYTAVTTWIAARDHAAPHTIVAGTNTDDLSDYRPGLSAAAAHEVVHPFVSAGASKQDVRALARDLDLHDVAALPASPCLASRIETGIAVTPQRLALIDDVERRARALLQVADLRCRVRDSGLVLELDHHRLANLTDDERIAISDIAQQAQSRHHMPLPLSFAPYRRGSAFLRLTP